MAPRLRIQNPAPELSRRARVENHYCSSCQRTQRFYRDEGLECLGCGKHLHLRRRAG